MNYEQFVARLKADFGLEFHIYKEKLAYLMVIWADGTDGSVAGPFAGHGHQQRLPHFDYLGWAYALENDKWYLLPDGISGWRNKDSTNPFPLIEEAPHELKTW